MEVLGHEIEAFSVAGFQTCIQLPRLGVAFDMGFCPRSAVKLPLVLVSHTHVDHAGAVVQHAALRGLLGMKPATYVAPRENEGQLRSLFDAWSKLDGTEHAHEILARSAGEELPAGHDLVARPFFSPHRVPCLGYGLWRTIHKLKAELAGLSPHEIGRLKREGREVTHSVQVPEIAYTGDTLIDVLEKEEVVRKARLLLMELTFLGGEIDVAGARARGHVHLDEVAARADLFENEAIVFLHFSARYSRDEVLRQLDRKLPAKLREKVTPLLTGHE
jgi:ribonuclease Z